MAKINLREIRNYGLATIGERGQIVIPKKIRDSMKINSGDKLMVFLKGNAVVAFMKPAKFDKLIREVADKIINLKTPNK